MLREAVVVRGDRAGTDVRALADIGVSDVGEVWNLRAWADDGVLDFHEGADLRAGAHPGAGPQVGERADGAALADLAADEVRAEHRRARADRRVDERRERTDRRPLGDHRAAVKRAAWLDADVGGPRHARADPARIG